MVAVQFSSVAQSCPTLCDPVDCSLPGSSAHGIFQASKGDAFQSSLCHETDSKTTAWVTQWRSTMGWKEPGHAAGGEQRVSTDAGRDWGQEEKGTTENEMAGWHH